MRSRPGLYRLYAAFTYTAIPYIHLAGIIHNIIGICAYLCLHMGDSFHSIQHTCRVRSLVKNCGNSCHPSIYTCTHTHQRSRRRWALWWRIWSASEQPTSLCEWMSLHRIYMAKPRKYCNINNTEQKHCCAIQELLSASADIHSPYTGWLLSLRVQIKLAIQSLIRSLESRDMHTINIWDVQIEFMASLFVFVKVDAVLWLELVNLTLLCIFIHFLESLQARWRKEGQGSGMRGGAGEEGQEWRVDCGGKEEEERRGRERSWGVAE